jgi:1-aminocyclopropane-1-carboxylate deaminase
VGQVIASVRPIDLRLPSPLEELRDDRITGAGLRLFLKRDDLISPDIPGNKWRKLKYNLEAAKKQGDRALLTFGGAYSNHIRATAAAGHYFGFATVGVIRGEEHLPLNPSLAYAVRRGMRLAYLDRAPYREKMSPDVIAMLHRRFGDFYLLPEGGSNADALQGCAEIPGEIDRRFDLACCPCGTGGTLAGLAQGLGPGQRALGFSVLKGGEFLTREVAALQREAFGAVPGNWSIECGFHFGGFARRSAALGEFIADFEERHALTLDWVYVAKMMYGILTLAQQGRFPAGSTIVAVITGGA